LFFNLFFMIWLNTGKYFLTHFSWYYSIIKNNLFFRNSHSIKTIFSNKSKIHKKRKYYPCSWKASPHLLFNLKRLWKWWDPEKKNSPLSFPLIFCSLYHKLDASSFSLFPYLFSHDFLAAQTRILVSIIEKNINKSM